MPPARDEPVPPVDPSLDALADEHLSPEFVAAARAGAWADVATEIRDRVYRARVLTSTWCARFDAEVQRRRAEAARAGRVLRPPNGMHEHGVILSEIGFAPFLDDLLARCVRPLAAALYADAGGDMLDEHHGYVVDYGAATDLDLGYHVDDSDVTLNLCLAGRFEGSQLRFRGRRCARHRQSPPRPDESFAIDHEPGVAILHLGAHRHEVDVIESGERRNLILWCRSRARRERGRIDDACAPWCGLSGR